MESCETSGTTCESMIHASPQSGPSALIHRLGLEARPAGGAGTPAEGPAIFAKLATANIKHFRECQ